MQSEVAVLELVTKMSELDEKITLLYEKVSFLRECIVKLEKITQVCQK
jgi:hypothetical protein